MNKLNIDEFDPFAVEPSLAAKSLCLDAISAAMDLIKNPDRDIVTSNIRHFIKELFVHVEELDEDVIENMSIDYSNTFNFPTDPQAIGHISKNAGLKEDNPSHFATLLSASTSEQQNESIAAILLFQVHILKMSEGHMLAHTAEFDYPAIMRELDSSIVELHKLCMLAKTFEPGIDYLSTKITRLEGAKKGGQKRRLAFAELKGFIIEKYWAQHSNKPSTQAARDIFAGLDDTWLNDDKDEPLLVDPVQRFTAWIRIAKKTGQ